MTPFEPAIEFEPVAECPLFTPASPPAIHDSTEAIPQPKAAHEILDEFFRKREAAHTKRQARETPEAHLRWENQERKPPTTSAPVYVWDWDFHSGLYKQTLIPKADRFDKLLEFGSQQKRYDPFYNEWNCADELGPEDPEDDDELELQADENWRAEIANLETAFLESPP